MRKQLLKEKLLYAWNLRYRILLFLEYRYVTKTWFSYILNVGGYFFLHWAWYFLHSMPLSDKKLGECFLQYIFHSFLLSLSPLHIVYSVRTSVSVNILIISMDWWCSELNKSILLQFVFAVPLIFINFQEIFINVLRIE